MITARPQPGERRRWPALLLLFLVGGVLCLGGTLAAQSVTSAPKTQFIPVPLHSVLEADYRQNPNPPRLPPLRPEIIWEAMSDQNPAAENLAARQAALLNNLQIPVSYVTPVVCQGSFIIYADRDTWVDSIQPTAAHGRDDTLQLGRDNGQTRRILLHFQLEDALPPGVFIAAARLELTPAEAPPAGAPKLDVFNLSGPFNENTVTWADQPETYRVDQPQPLPIVNRHAWDVTGLVQAWLLGYYPHDGLAVEAPSSLIYYSREADRQIADNTNRLGPRLVIECGGNPTPAPQTVVEAKPSVPVTPGPDTPQIEIANTPPSPLTGTPAPSPLLPTPLLSPTPLLFTPTPPLPSPTLPLPSPTIPLATPTVPLPGSPTPIPTTTPLPTVAPTLTPIPTATPIPTPVPTSPPTSVPPTNTPSPTATATATSTPTATATATPTPPTLSINDVMVTEGNTGTVAAIFTISLSAASSQVVTVNYATADGTATTADNDYSQTSGTLTFPAGTTAQTLPVWINGDTKVELNETFYVNLSNPVNAGLADAQGMATIINDDNSHGQIFTCTVASQDAWIQSPDAGNGTAQLRTKFSPNEVRTVIGFDLSFISPLSTVLTSTLSMYVETPNSGQTISITHLITDWNEIGVTWISPWITPGGDFDPTTLATFSPATTGEHSINITGVTPGAFYGMLLQVSVSGNNGNAFFRSKENLPPTYPRLCITYQ